MSVTLGGDFPVAPGYPQYSGKLIPVIFSRLWNAKFYRQTILNFICNTDWEMEVRNHGDQVVIRNIPTLTFERYFKGMTLNYQVPEVTTQTLNIDQGLTFAFSADVIDLKQTDVNFTEKFFLDGTNQIKKEVERDMFSVVFASADASNQGAAAGFISGGYNLGAAGAPVLLDASNILSFIIRVNLVLDELEIPRDGNRWQAYPSQICGLIKSSELKDASLTGDAVSRAVSGRIGRIDDTDIYCTNNLTTATDAGKLVYNAMAGHRSGLTFAGQLTRFQSVTPESTFGEKHRALFSYGYGVALDDALAWLYIAAA